MPVVWAVGCDALLSGVVFIDHDPHMIRAYPAAFPALLQHEAPFILEAGYGSASLLVCGYSVQ
jgi:hypothetical protein